MVHSFTPMSARAVAGSPVVIQPAVFVAAAESPSRARQSPGFVVTSLVSVV